MSLQASKLISIIVPVYNVEDYLPRCIHSILSQTYTNLEIILVDDGSTDRSGELCDAFAQSDSRIIVIHQVNGGLSDARNTGLEVAKGDFVGFVDSDDWIDPQMYQQMIHYCLQGGAEMAMCRYRSHYPDRIEDGSTDSVLFMDNKEALDLYIDSYSKYCIHNSVWSKLFRRDIIKGVEFALGRQSEDIMYTTKALCKATKCIYIDQALYNYERKREDRIMQDSYKERMMNDEIPFWKEHVEWIAQCGYQELARKAIYHYCRRLLSYFLESYRLQGMNQYTQFLCTEIRSNAKEIRDVYQDPYIRTGDRMRMRLFLRSPKLYERMDAAYQVFVRRKQKKKKS